MMLENLKIAILRQRNKSGDTQGVVGIRAGIVESRLSAIINGRIKATQGERAALSAVLGETEDYLFNQSEQVLVAACEGE